MKSYNINRKNLVFFRQWTNKKYAAFRSFKKIIKICTLVVAYLIISKPILSNAQGKDTSDSRIYELDEVTIQSTLIELKNAETGRSIEVINGSQLQSLPVTTIDELLRYIPGVDAQQRGAFGSQTDFSLRGSNFNQVLILIDGQKINDPLTSHFNSNIPVSPSEIERIEIIRGSASAEYGPDATGGVINIITKTFSNNPQADIFDANAKIQTGQYKLFNTDGGFYYGDDKIRLSAGVLLNKSDGNPLTSGLKGFFDINTVSVSGQFRFDSCWSTSYRYGKDYRNFNAQWFYTTYAGDKAVEKIQRQRHQFQLNRITDKNITRLQASYINTNDYYLYAPGVSPNNNSSNYAEVQVTHEIKVSSSFTALLGSAIQQNGVLSTDRGNHSINHYSVFFTTSLSPIKKFSINVGLRSDNDQKFGSNLLPQCGVSFKLSKKIIIRGNVGRSVRTPDFTESYSNNFRTDTLRSGNALGNPNLKAEKSWNYEAGWDLQLFKNTSVSLTGFYRQAAGIIDYVWTDAAIIQMSTLKYKPGSYFWFAQNNSLAKTLGIESRLSFNQRINSEFIIKYICGYTFLNQNESFDKPSRYASLTPKHLFNFETEAIYGPVILGINGLYKFRNSQWNEAIQRYLKQSYMIWNANVDFAVYKKNIFLSLTAYNLFDEKYSDFIGAEMPGRWIAVGIKFKL
jgi:vitamin B12 transporter